LEKTDKTAANYNIKYTKGSFLHITKSAFGPHKLSGKHASECLKLDVFIRMHVSETNVLGSRK
jgi:hypothetical protein